MGMNRIIVGMAITMLLLALPAAASDYTLEIFGNANEDDTINMQDVTYTELIILEYRDKTELADGKHDGKINMQDVTQIELTILGKELELTLVDSADRIVTVKKPVERVVELSFSNLEVMRSLKVEKDKIVGIGEWTKQNTNKAFFPEFSEFPSVGSASPFTVDFEKILDLDPDVVLLYATFGGTSERIQNELEDLNPDIVVLRFDSWYPETYVEEVRKLGYIFDKGDKADEFLEFYSGVMNTINERVEGISEDERPSVYYEHTEPYQAWCGGSGYSKRHIELVGGKNIFSGDFGGSVDAEAVVERNPEIVVKCSWNTGGYHTDDLTILSSVRDEVMNRPELAEVTAIQNKRVYVFNRHVVTSAFFVGIAYTAKWFYPELFEDLDPKTIHQQYLTEFQELDYDVYEHGVFVYPPFEES
ncbi:MAG: ABC transporter substrate-binding protein [Euryarchaeota archaeon]|nr:ABC transporter substrate-binding protein [Euryarchaeota archaeon]